VHAARRFGGIQHGTKLRSSAMVCHDVQWRAPMLLRLRSSSVSCIISVEQQAKIGQHGYVGRASSRCHGRGAAQVRHVHCAQHAHSRVSRCIACKTSSRPAAVVATWFLTFSLLGSTHGLLQQLRSVCGLTPGDEDALRQLQQHNDALLQGTVSGADQLASVQERGAEDVARHGLRRCALPACGATEAHPKLFKLCGRCRGAAYCCAAHSVEDWKRHKREDGCKAAS
jgi:hypothetical protein